MKANRQFLGLNEVEVVSPLHPSRPRDVALVRLGDEQYVLKSKAVPKGLLKQWGRRLLGHGDIVHEARVYRALETVEPMHFRTPRLITSDEKTFLLLEYTPSEPGRITNEASLATVGRAIAEFQRLGLTFPRQPLRHTLQRYHVAYAICRFARQLQTVMPSAVVRQCLALTIRLHQLQPPLPRFLITHTDLNPGNLALGADGKLVLLDFASVAYTRRWIFGDVVSYGFSYRSGTDFNEWISPVLVASYVSEIERHPAFKGVRSNVQLRMALLLRMLFRRLNRPHPRAMAFIVETLLNDKAFESWYTSLMAEGRHALAELDAE